jgi:proteasome lid subunit RPN8/RPN11
VLLGSNRLREIIVRGVLNTRNVSTLLGGFVIPDEEIRRARLIATRRGEAIVALFHSHPGGPTSLSAADREAIQYSEWPWVIISQGKRASDIRMEYHAKPG